jgi:hypothetical protein
MDSAEHRRDRPLLGVSIHAGLRWSAFQKDRITVQVWCGLTIRFQKGEPPDELHIRAVLTRVFDIAVDRRREEAWAPGDRYVRRLTGASPTQPAELSAAEDWDAVGGELADPTSMTAPSSRKRTTGLGHSPAADERSR